MRSTIASVAVLVLCLSVSGQEHQMAGHAAAPVLLEDGLGDAHFAVSTNNAEAQRFFDQGLRYVYGFNHDAAVASFRRATEIDPQLALGYWGMALALGPNINMDVDADREKQAFALVRDALAQVEHASPKERDLIDAVARRYSDDPNADLKKLSADYAGAMREVHRKYPADPDIATLFAESLMDLTPWRFWTHDGEPTENTGEILAVLESVLKTHPRHMGANHYYIHAVEASSQPERALSSAKRLETLAPSAGHLVHMPAHIYQRTGSYAAAAEANAAGARADRVFVKRYGQGMYALMYYNHNLDFGAASYAMIGQFDTAKQFADEVTANAVAISKDVPPVEAFAADALKVLLRFGRWTEILRAPDQTAGPYTAAFRHYARGIAFARLGNVEGARSEWNALETSRAALTDDPGFLQNSGKSLGAVASTTLQGQIAAAEGKWPVAIAAYRRAVEAQDALNYNEPADWYYPVRESLGAALLMHGEPAEAEKVFREDLEQNAKNPRSLFGLSEALKAQQKPYAAPASSFAKAWRGGKLRVEDL